MKQMKPRVLVSEEIDYPESAETSFSNEEMLKQMQGTVNGAGEMIRTLTPKLSSPTGEVITGLALDSVIVNSALIDSAHSSTSPLLLDFITRSWPAGNNAITKASGMVDFAISSGLVDQDVIISLAKNPSVAHNAIKDLVKTAKDKLNKNGKT